MNSPTKLNHLTSATEEILSRPTQIFVFEFEELEYPRNYLRSADFRFRFENGLGEDGVCRNVVIINANIEHYADPVSPRTTEPSRYL